MTKGSRIKALREAGNMSQEELGRRCGTTKQTIYKYETGTITNIPLNRLEKIAQALGVTAAYIMGWDEDAPTRLPRNTVRLAGRDGSCAEKTLSDEQFAALKLLIDQLPEGDDR